MYRTTKSFAVVHFSLSPKGRVVLLPEGAELRLIGASRMPQCFEVSHNDQHYNIFKVDLLGKWSTPVTHRTITLPSTRKMAARA